MGGSDTVRGIGYQHAHAVLSAIELVEGTEFASMRVEGTSDAIDIELLDAHGDIAVGKQVKIRSQNYSWSKADLVRLLEEWIDEDVSEFARYQFVTNGRLGPSGNMVKRALEDAVSGNLDALSEVLGVDAGAYAVKKAARASVVQDVSSAGAIVASAEQRVRALLPSPRSPADAEERSIAAVNSLNRLLWQRASMPDPDDRLVTRLEIFHALGIPPTVAPIEPWVGAMRERYVDEVLALAWDYVPASLEVEDGSAQMGPLGVEAILNENQPVVLAGPTGLGKSTAAREIRDLAAKNGRAAIVVNAEAYLAGRIDSLIAEAVSNVLGRDVPTLTGRQILSESSTILVIDGASEIPRTTQDELGEDLRTHIASGRGAKVVLVGRVVSAMRVILPASATPVTYRISPFDYWRRLELARTQIEAADDHTILSVLAKAEEALGDAAGSPLILTMAIDSILTGAAFDDRAAVYSSAIARLGARVGAEDLPIIEIVLGTCFARLLDQGKRYTDMYTWRRLFKEAVEEQSAQIGRLDPERISEAVRRSGLVVQAGRSGMVTALHDSFADYFAGAALASGATPFPEQVRIADEERLLFAAQKGGVDGNFALSLAKDIPFAIPRLASSDRRVPGGGAPEEVSTVVRALLPADHPASADLWHAPDGRIVGFFSDGPGRWLSDEEGRAALRSRAGVVGASPTDLAMRLWRQWLIGMLRIRAGRERPHPKTGEEAREAVVTHVAAVAKETERLLRLVVPQRHIRSVADDIGPMGLSARVSPVSAGEQSGQVKWGVVHSRSEHVDVKLVDYAIVDTAYEWQSTLESMISRPPVVEAAERIKRSIDRMAGGRWL